MTTHLLGSIMQSVDVTKMLLCMRYCKGDWRYNNEKTHVTAPSQCVWTCPRGACRCRSQHLHWPRGRRSFPWHHWCCGNYDNQVFPFLPHYNCRVWTEVMLWFDSTFGKFTHFQCDNGFWVVRWESQRSEQELSVSLYLCSGESLLFCTSQHHGKISNLAATLGQP